MLTETKLTDAGQDRAVFQEHLPGYALFHSCTQSNNSGHCRTGSGGVATAVHKSLTSQNSVELICHKHPAAKSHLKAFSIRQPPKRLLDHMGSESGKQSSMKERRATSGDTGCHEP